jgi:multidrug efflux pump subunit AcrA (membrane-fusion protein)
LTTLNHARAHRGVRPWLLGVLGLAAIAAAIVGMLILRPTSAPPPVAPTVTPASITIDARGRILPERSARVAPLLSGTISQVFVEEGDAVTAQQELMRVSFGGETNVLVAPYAGTVARLDYRLGDTILAGQTAVTIADLSSFIVETTDLDEFTVGKLAVGMPATVIVEGFGDQPIAGRIRRIALTARTGAGGDITYPVEVAIDPTTLPLRWGMTTRIKFNPET